MLRPFLAALALFPLAAGAQDCPTAADLDDGIRFELTNGEAEEFKRHPDGRVASVFYTGGEPVTLLMLYHGLYLSEVIDIENYALVPGSESIYTYSLAPEDLPLPRDGASFTAEATVREGDEVFRESHIHKFGERSITVFGDCAYRSLPVSVEYVPDDNHAIDHLLWLPDLGVSLLVRAVDDDGADRYTYLTVSKTLKGGFH